MNNPLLIGSAVVLVGGLLVAPRFVGNHVEGRMNEIVAGLDDNPMVEARWREYHHGWFSSSGVLDIRLTVPVTDVQPLQKVSAWTASPAEKPEMTTIDFQYQLDLAHGPVIFDSGVTVALASWTGQIKQSPELETFLSWDQSQPLYRQTGKIGVDGDVHVQENISPFSVAGEQLSVTFSGFQGAGEESDGVFAYNGKAESLVIGGPANTIKIEGVRIDSDIEADLVKVIQGDLYTMNGLFSVDKVLSGEGGEFRQLQVEVNTTLNEDESLADIRAGYRIGEISGVDYSLSDLGFDVIVTNYSAAFNQQYKQLVKKAAFQNTLNPELIEAAWKESLPLLMRSNPTVRLENLHFTLPEGTFKSQLSLSLNSVDLQAQQLNNPEFWVRNLVLNASASADKPLAERLAKQLVRIQVAKNPELKLSEAELEQASVQQASMMLAMLGARGMLRDEGNQLSLDFRMSNGQANLNGQAIPLPAGLGQQ